jgi:hypothetical protein
MYHPGHGKSEFCVLERTIVIKDDIAHSQELKTALRFRVCLNWPYGTDIAGDKTVCYLHY